MAVTLALGSFACGGGNGALVIDLLKTFRSDSPMNYSGWKSGS